jgi:hypothetical protein
MTARKTTRKPATQGRKRAPAKKRQPARTQQAPAPRDASAVTAVSALALVIVVAGAAITLSVTAYVMQSYQSRAFDARFARHAAAISSLRVETVPRVLHLERVLEQETRQDGPKWLRHHMVTWCLEASRLNKGFACPSPSEITGKKYVTPETPVRKPDAQSAS